MAKKIKILKINNGDKGINARAKINQNTQEIVEALDQKAEKAEVQQIVAGYNPKGDKPSVTEIKAIINPQYKDAYRALDTGHTWKYDGLDTEPYDPNKWIDLGIISVSRPTSEEGLSEDLAISQKAWTESKQIVDQKIGFIQIKNGKYIFAFTDEVGSILCYLSRDGKIYGKLGEIVDYDSLTPQLKTIIDSIQFLEDVVSIKQGGDNLFEFEDSYKTVFAFFNSKGELYCRLASNSVEKKHLSLDLQKMLSSPIIETGLAWAAIGDSITKRDELLFGYQSNVMQKFTFSNYQNLGFSGYTLAKIATRNSIVDATVNIGEFDLYTLLATTNDFSNNAEVGVWENYTNNTGYNTVYGALRVMIDRFYSKNSYCKIVLMTPLRRNDQGFTPFSKNELGYALNDYAEAIRKVASYEGIYLIDLFNESGITERNITLYTSDGVHPNNEGYFEISKRIINAFTTILKN